MLLYGCFFWSEGLGCRKGLNRMIDLVLKNLPETNASAAAQPDKDAGAGVASPVFAVDWASTSVGEQGGAHTDHKAALLGLQRLLSVICPPREELRADIAEQDAQAGRTAAAGGTDAAHSCAHAAVFSRSCGTDNDWRRMIGRRCNVSTLSMEPAQVTEILGKARNICARMLTCAHVC